MSSGSYNKISAFLGKHRRHKSSAAPLSALQCFATVNTLSFCLSELNLHFYLVRPVRVLEYVVSLLGPLNVLKAHCMISQMSITGTKKEKKKKAFCSQLGFHPTAVTGTISRPCLFTLQRCGQIEKKKCFHSVYFCWIGLF